MTKFFVLPFLTVYGGLRVLHLTNFPYQVLDGFLVGEKIFFFPLDKFNLLL